MLLFGSGTYESLTTVATNLTNRAPRSRSLLHVMDHTAPPAATSPPASEDSNVRAAVHMGRTVSPTL